jgi:hypothetical protein
VNVARAQGLFYVTSGLWPVVHYPSFEAATGPKVDRWLVKTIGGLIAAVGVALLAGSSRDRVLGVGSALVLGAVGRLGPAPAALVVTCRPDAGGRPAFRNMGHLRRWTSDVGEAAAMSRRGGRGP